MIDPIYLDYINLNTNPESVGRYQLSSSFYVVEHHAEDDPSPYIYKNPSTRKILALLITTIFPIKNTNPYKSIEPRETTAFLDHQLAYHISQGGTLDAFVEVVRDAIETFLYEHPELKEHPANRYYQKWIGEKDHQLDNLPTEPEIEEEGHKIIKIKKREGTSIFTANQIGILADYLRDKKVTLPELPKTTTSELWSGLTNRSNNTIYGRSGGGGLINPKGVMTKENLLAIKKILTEILHDVNGRLNKL